MVATLVAINANEAEVAPIVEPCGNYDRPESGVRNQAVCFTLVILLGFSSTKTKREF
jgi:hypothetical protein